MVRLSSFLWCPAMLSMPIIMSDLVCHKDNILFSSHKIILHCPLCVYLSQFLEKEPLTIAP